MKLTPFELLIKRNASLILLLPFSLLPPFLNNIGKTHAQSGGAPLQNPQ